MENDLGNWITLYQQMQWLCNVEVHNYYQRNIRRRKAAAVAVILM